MSRSLSAALMLVCVFLIIPKSVIIDLPLI